jgi:hypothetical protein
MSTTHASGGPRARRRETAQHAHVSPELALELKRPGSHPPHAVPRLEREAQPGEKLATPVILIVGMALALGGYVALAVGTTLAVQLVG